MHIKLTSRVIRKIGVWIIIIAMALPTLPTVVSTWTLVATMAGLFVVGFACIGGAIWYLGRLPRH